jgi:hypothetical protein
MAQKRKTGVDYVVEELLGNEATYRKELGLLVSSFVPEFHLYATDPRVNFRQNVGDEVVAAQLFGQFENIKALHDNLWDGYSARLALIAGKAGTTAAAATSELKLHAFAEALAMAAPFFGLYSSCVCFCY